jgi:hypothetical protein
MMDSFVMALRPVLLAVVSPEPILVRDNLAMKMATSALWTRVTTMVCAKRMKTVTIARLTALLASRPVAETAFANHRPAKIVFRALRIVVENSQVQQRIVSVAEMVTAAILSAAAIAAAHRMVLRVALNRPLLTAAVISFVRAQKQVVVAGSIVAHRIQANAIHRHHQVATMMACANKEKIATVAAMIAPAEPAVNPRSGIVAEMAPNNQRKGMVSSAMAITNAKTGLARLLQIVRLQIADFIFGYGIDFLQLLQIVPG